MNNNLKVLKLFVDNKDKSFTIKKASELLKINYRIVYEEIESLAKENLLSIIRQGNSKVCSFNYQYSSKIVEIENIRKIDVFKNKDIQLLYNRIKEVRNPFYILVLFGSQVKNKSKSDIDICIIKDSKDTKITEMLSITPIDIHLQEFTSQQFLSMLKRKENNLANEIIQNNIILYGLEAFYELVKDNGGRK
jgi:hypothetical protein